MIEKWKDIPGYEGLYQVSNFGKVKSIRTKKLHKGKYPIKVKPKELNPWKESNGYYQVTLWKNKKRKVFYVHQLVALCFLGHISNGLEYQIDHIDNDKTNNNLNNLQIITLRENSSKDRKGTSKYTGVCKVNKTNKWRAMIQINKKNIYLGSFDNEIDAKNAYLQKLNSI